MTGPEGQGLGQVRAPAAGQGLLRIRKLPARLLKKHVLERKETSCVLPPPFLFRGRAVPPPPPRSRELPRRGGSPRTRPFLLQRVFPYFHKVPSSGANWNKKPSPFHFINNITV